VKNDFGKKNSSFSAVPYAQPEWFSHIYVTDPIFLTQLLEHRSKLKGMVAVYGFYALFTLFTNVHYATESTFMRVSLRLSVCSNFRPIFKNSLGSLYTVS
uniref:Uncharacterized protein n=1 Tax=Parascaris univalens TaxID=6257 RepID=A0A915AVK8_PARUN